MEIWTSLTIVKDCINMLNNVKRLGVLKFVKNSKILLKKTRRTDFSRLFTTFYHSPSGRFTKPFWHNTTNGTMSKFYHNALEQWFSVSYKLWLSKH